jgi:hypothetical protein
MARKRMLSPDIWESESFSSLSDLAKILFIGLISLSDDEGRGKANPSYIKSMLFPYDENRRVADVKSALSEIARCTSTQFYNVNGNEYYCLTNWEKWQKIDKPSKSKLPAPPMCGEGEELDSNTQFVEGSSNIRRTFVEGSSTKKNRIEVEENKNRSRSSSRATAILSDGDYDSLCKLITKEETDYYIERVKAFLQKNPDAKFSVIATILKWHKEDKAKEKAQAEKDKPVEKSYTTEALNALFDNIPYEDI